VETSHSLPGDVRQANDILSFELIQNFKKEKTFANQVIGNITPGLFNHPVDWTPLSLNDVMNKESNVVRTYQCHIRFRDVLVH